MKKLNEKNLWETVYEVIDDECFRQLDVEFIKYFILLYKTEFNVSHFILVDVKK